MTKAEERAFDAYPDFDAGSAKVVQCFQRQCYINGYEQAEKDIISIIESRISEIIGDAQPRPALRAELEELIKQITEAKK